MPARSAARARSPRFGLVAALALTVVLTPAAGAAPAPAGVPARSGTLSTGTAITWTGAKGFLLHVPADTHVPTYGARLFVRGGVSAFVRYRRYQPGCTPSTCGWTLGELTRTRATARMARQPEVGPGTDHHAWFGAERLLERGTYEFYLFTEGEATLLFDRTELPRAPRAYRATGRVRGAAQRIPARCGALPLACDPAAGYGGRLLYGGVQVSVGAAGSVEHFVASVDEAGLPTWQYPQSHAVRGCVHPAWPTDRTSADPADHPWGCPMYDAEDAELTSSHLLQVGYMAVPAAPLFNGYTVGQRNGAAAGKAYVGFQASTAHDVSKPNVEAWAVWFTYGIG